MNSEVHGSQRMGHELLMIASRFSGRGMKDQGDGVISLAVTIAAIATTSSEIVT